MGRLPQGAAEPRARSVAVTALLIAAFVASLLTLPQPEDPGPPDLPELVQQLESRWRTDLFSARPAYLPEPSGPLSTASPPAALVDAALVSKSVNWDGRIVPYLVPDTALPLRYVVDRRLAERFGQEQVVDAVAQWDGIPGSRWSTEFVSLVDLHDRRPRSTGMSTVYLRHDCPEHFLGGAFWHSRPGTAYLEVRHGTAALYSPQIDIAVCDGVRDHATLRAVVAHEVGHMMGMAHLCEPGEVCWRHGLADEERRCRVMYYRFGLCREGVDGGEHDAARHLYPTLARLYGPTLAETSARAAYATTWTHTADRVVLASSADSPYTAAAAVSLAGALEAPFLLADPDPRACVAGATADELSRVAENPATVVLVGSWPRACEQALEPWDLQVERVTVDGDEAPVEPYTPTVGVAVADVVAAVRGERDERPESALLVVADGGRDSMLDAAAAAALAGHRGVPLLYTEPGGLASAVQEWLVRHPSVLRVQVLGELDAFSNQVLDDLVDMGLLVARVPGRDAVERALRLAERSRPYVPVDLADEDPVVIASSRTTGDALVAAGVAARVGAPLLFTPPRTHEDVLDWLERRTPHGGYLVGSPETLPYPLQWAYTVHVLATDDPAPSREEAPRLQAGRSVTGFADPVGPPTLDGRP